MPQLEANIPVKSDNQQWQLDKPINHGAKKKKKLIFLSFQALCPFFGKLFLNTSNKHAHIYKLNFVGDIKHVTGKSN